MKKYIKILICNLCLILLTVNIGAYNLAPIELQSDIRLPKSVSASVISKVTAALAKHGIAYGSLRDIYSFAIVPSIVVENTRTIRGIPARSEVEFALSLSIVDLMTDQIFLTHNIYLKGIGANKTNAIVKGISHLNLNNRLELS